MGNPLSQEKQVNFGFPGRLEPSVIWITSLREWSIRESAFYASNSEGESPFSTRQVFLDEG